MNGRRLAELKEKYKDRNLLEELSWGIYANHSGYTSKQNGEFLNWLCLMAYKALRERPQGDLKSSEALKAYARDVLCGNNPTNSLLIRMFDEIIDNAPPATDHSVEIATKLQPNCNNLQPKQGEYKCVTCKYRSCKITEKPCRECSRSWLDRYEEADMRGEEE